MFNIMDKLLFITLQTKFYVYKMILNHIVLFLFMNFDLNNIIWKHEKTLEKLK